MDVYRRVGRGGAGNFYTQKEIDEATKGKPDVSSIPRLCPLGPFPIQSHPNM